MLQLKGDRLTRNKLCTISKGMKNKSLVSEDIMNNIVGMQKKEEKHKTKWDTFLEGVTLDCFG